MDGGRSVVSGEPGEWFRAQSERWAMRAARESVSRRRVSQGKKLLDRADSVVRGGADVDVEATASGGAEKVDWRPGCCCAAAEAENEAAEESGPAAGAGAAALRLP